MFILLIGFIVAAEMQRVTAYSEKESLQVTTGEQTELDFQESLFDTSPYRKTDVLLDGENIQLSNEEVQQWEGIIHHLKEPNLIAMSTGLSVLTLARKASIRLGPFVQRLGRLAWLHREQLLEFTIAIWMALSPQSRYLRCVTIVQKYVSTPPRPYFA